MVNNSRTTDLGTILTDGASGFSPRKRTGVGLFFHLFVIASMVILAVALLVYYQSPRGCALAMAIGFSFLVIIENVQKLKRTKDSLEFMNALFSSALGSGYKFCFIVKSSDDIVFYNRPFQTIFPAYIMEKGHTLARLLSLYNVTQVDKDILYGFISSNSSGNVKIKVRSSLESEGEMLSFFVEPIERPTGFFLVRGK